MRKRRAIPSFLIPLGGSRRKAVAWGRSQLQQLPVRVERRVELLVDAGDLG